MTRALLVVAALAAVLLLPCLLGLRTYVPYDLAAYPPVATTLDDQEVEALREGANTDASEPPIWFAPEYALAQRALAGGSYPHWNPYARGGTVLAAHGHMGFLDPLHWPLLVAEPVRDGLVWPTFLAFVLAGVLTFGFLRALGLADGSALFGALAFALSGTLTANGHWFMRLEVLAWLPGMLWAALATARGRGAGRAGPAGGLALALALTWMAGFPPYAGPTTVITAVWCLALVVGDGRREGLRAGAGTAGWLLAAGILGLCLAAIHVLPQLEFYPHSARPLDPDPAAVSRKAMDPVGLLGYVMRAPFGHPTAAELPYDASPFVQAWCNLREWGTGLPLRSNYNFTEYAVYPGAVVLVLALAGLLARHRARWLPLLALPVLWLLACGVGPLRPLYELPILEAIPPMRWVGPAALFVAIAAALGFQAVCGGVAWSRGRHRTVLVLVVAAVAGCVALAVWLGGSIRPGTDPFGIAGGLAERFQERYPSVDAERIRTRFLVDGAGGSTLEAGRSRLQEQALLAALLLGAAGGLWCWVASGRGRRWVPGLMVAAAVVDLLAFGLPINRGRVLEHELETPVHTFLRQERDRRAGEGGITIARAAPEVTLPWSLPPGTLYGDRIRDLNVYTFLDGRSGPLFEELYGPGVLGKDGSLWSLPDDPRLAHPALDAMGLRFLLSTASLEHAGEPVGPELRGPEGKSFHVYERPDALPRAWVVPRLAEVEDAAAARVRMADPGFDPRREVIVTRARARELGGGPGADPAAGERAVRFRTDGLDEVVLEVAGGPAGFLVLADTFLPGWDARIDGEPVPIVPGNVFQRVVRLPAGACTVRFHYFTPGLATGAAVTAGALGLLAVLLLVGLRHRVRQEP